MWQVLQVYYYEDNKEPLLLSAIRPFVQALKETSAVNKVYMRRHWKKGPHIDIFVHAEQEVFDTTVMTLADDMIGTWLREHPSKKVIEATEYEKLSEQLGAWELEKGPYLPLCPDNSLQVDTYDPKGDLLQGVSVVEAKETFMSTTLDLVFNVLQETKDDKGARYEALIQMMACVAECYPSGIVHGHLSFRSHVEAYLHEFDSNGRMLTMFKQYDEKWATTVDKLVGEVCHEFEEESFFTLQQPLLKQWIEALHNVWDHMYEKALQGGLSSNTAHYEEISKQVGDNARQRWTPSEDRKMSPFHQHLFNEEKGMEVLNSPEFATYRLLVNYFYYLLPLFNINPNEKHLLCYLVSNSVERLKSVTWQELMNVQGN